MPTTPTREPSMVTESVQMASMRAMGLLASGRAWLVFLVTIALLLQVGLFGAANWGDVLHKRAGVGPDAQAPQKHADGEAAEPGAGQPSGNFLQGFWPASKWQQVMEIGLPIAGLVAVAAALILVVLTIAGIGVNLVGRLPGLAAMIGAFYWSLVVAVLVLPWGRLLGGVLAEKLPWVFCTYKDIDAAVGGAGDTVQFGRFLVWPACVLVAAWICGGRFGNAYWQAVSLAEMEAKSRTDQSR
jgi:hypothetical protein